MDEFELFVQEHADSLRLGAFAGLLALFSVAEALAPRRPRSVARGRRWSVNLGLAVTGTLVGRLLAPIGAVIAATFASDRGLGALNALEVPPALALVLALVALDLSVWTQHYVTHRVPLLWRLHRVHHFDLDLDATSGLRFHPLEIAVSLAWKSAVVVALGASPAAVIVFEVVLNGMAIFNHANLRLPGPIDRAVRVLLVTPDMHRVHHSVDSAETNANFGFALSLWDRIFRTYRAQPVEGHDGMTLGLREVRDPARAEGLGWLLSSPGRRDPWLGTERADL